jgi:hypothetical protein
VAVLALFASGLFSRCANVRGSLTGGLKDTLPPRVTAMTPDFNATGIFPRRIYIQFDEFVQLKDLQKEFFTSPLLSPNPKARIKKKGVVIDIEAPLDSATTYVMNLGSSVSDNNEGNPYHALKYTFSTGPHIDSMIMSGFAANAFTGDTTKGAYVLFYDARDVRPGPDSLLFDLYRARAVAKTMSNGGFIFANLRPIDYKIYAMLDNNGNTMYDPGTDEVAFLDSLYNPTEMPSFLMWYDTTRMYPVAEPQLFFDTFIEDPERQQNLSRSVRESAQRVMLRFSAKNPKIDTFELRGIDPRHIITEQTLPTRDSVLYWIDLPPEEVPDTILGRIVYDRPDSTGLIMPYGQDLRLIYNRPAPPPEQEVEAEEESEPEPAEAEDPEIAALRAEGLLSEVGEPADSIPVDSVPPSPMVFRFAGKEAIIPHDHLRLDFELPVIRFDTASIRLFRVAEAASAPEQRGRGGAAPAAPVETEIPFTVSADSTHIREFTFRAGWVDGVSYRLAIPAGAIETIDREVNDSIDHAFKVADKAALATLTLQPSAPNPAFEYIVQVTDTTGRTILRELNGLTGADTVTIHYLTPGPVKLRLVEDRNRNGRWDTGILVRGIQPEVVRWYYDGAEKTNRLTLIEKAEVQIEVDLSTLFMPRVLVSAADSLSGETTAPAVDAGTEAPPVEAVRAEPRVETFELLDKAADKKARKEAKQAARRQRKEEEQQRREQLKRERDGQPAETPQAESPQVQNPQTENPT